MFNKFCKGNYRVTSRCLSHVIFLKKSSLHLYWIIFQITWCQSYLCSNVRKVYQLRSSQKENFQNSLKLYPLEIDQKKWEIMYLMHIMDFWGFFWFWFTFEIHNQCNPLVLCQRLWNNFVCNVKASIKLSDKCTL